MTNAVSFRSILVPLDGSSFAEEAVPLAARIAQGSGGKLRLALIHQLPSAPLDPIAAKTFTSMELAARKSERAYLRAVQARLRDAGTRLSSAFTMTGSPASALMRYARELGPDLVVMATHGRGGVRRAWLGSVADHLVRNLNVPVLLVRPQEREAAAEPPPAGGQILVPLDGSALAEEALPAAVALAAALGLDLLLLQVVRPVLLSRDPTLPIPSAYDQELTDACRTQAQDYLDDIAEQLRDRRLRATAVAVLGWHAAEAILDVARPETVSAIVIATHGRGGFRRIALGSVADKIVRGAEVPVLVYRPAKGRRATKSPVRRASGKATTTANR
jgi:nucleotide-binding universal stress UspA family protein